MCQQRLTGSWTYAGVVDPQWQGTPYGPAGKFSGKFTARFVLDGFFVLENAEETYAAGGAATEINLFEYDPKTKTYRGHAFWSNGSTYDTVYTLDEQRMTASMTQITKEGEKAMVKAVWDYNSGLDAFKSVWELSVDGGKTWKYLATYDGKKQKD